MRGKEKKLTAILHKERSSSTVNNTEGRHMCAEKE